MSKGKEWIAGIDILKIISMLMIITLHYIPLGMEVFSIILYLCQENTNVHGYWKFFAMVQ